MEDYELYERLEALENRVKHVLKAYHQSQVLLKKTQEENEVLKNIVEKQNEQLNNFKYQDKISKIVGTLEASGYSPEELRSQIDEYIAKIELCITYLSKSL